MGGGALLAAAIVLVLHFPLIRMPDGYWLFARTPGRIEAGGRGYRPYIWGVDALIRLEIDTDGDGDWDIRGDDWQAELPRWCWQRSGWSWIPIPPTHCGEERGKLLPALTGNEMPSSK